MLPSLREELALFPGPSASSGAPTWSLQDPVRNLFFRIDWLTFEILSRWELGDPKVIQQAIEQETPIQLDEDDVAHVIRFLTENELLQHHHADATAWYLNQLDKRRTSWATWLLHHYLFFRIPLWRPNAWLDRALPWVKPFYTKTFLVLTLLALLTGLIEVSRQWDPFVTTLLDAFTWEGILGYSVTLACVKFLHELGHAFTAKRHGCRVPTIGVAFLVMFPMAYTDVNEVWKISDNRQRLQVGAAGILTELTIAAWATLAWGLFPDGLFRNSAFLLATTTWVSTVMINASPFMRFDGYFLFMDWLDMPNLHQRSFALARWRMRKTLFGLDDPAPEYLTPRRQRIVLLFAYITWLYRLVVFSGIALLVYRWFPKPLGPMLASIEIGWFMLLPIWRELTIWYARLPDMLGSRRAWFTLSLLALLLIVAFIPWDKRVQSQGLLSPAEHYPIISPGQACIKSLLIGNGQAVNRHQGILELESPDLKFQRESAVARENSLQWKAGSTGVDPKLNEQRQVIEAARGKVGAELTGIRDEQARYKPMAPFSGRFYYRNPDIQPGAWVAKNELLGILEDTLHWQIETYFTENEINRISVGDRGRFYSETPGIVELPLRVERIDRDATHILPDGLLASTHGGTLLARDTKNKQIVPEIALYRVTLSLDVPYHPEEPQILRGHVVVYGTPKALLERYTLTASALFFREAGF